MRRPGFGETCRLVLVPGGGVQGFGSGGYEVPVRSPRRCSRVGVLGSGFWFVGP